MSINKVQIGHRIREIRRNAGLSQYEFSKIMEVGNGTLARYELGEHSPSAKFIGRLFEKYWTDPLWLIFGKEIDKNSKLSSDELRLISLYRNNDDSHRKLARSVLEVNNQY